MDEMTTRRLDFASDRSFSAFRYFNPHLSS
jgi:hypothetical protein